MPHAPVAPAGRALVLGSTSRYRRELLQRLNLPFEVAAPEVDETPQPGEAPAALARRLALAKAHAVAARFPEAVVIGCDQVADLDGEPLGKPGTHERAVQQLRRMSGRSVVFQTALAVACRASGFEQQDLAPVRVRFRPLHDAEIEAYLRAEQPYDCAGSAKSEGLGIALLEAIDSDDPTALVGLPLIRTCRLIRAAGVARAVSAAAGTLYLVPSPLDFGCAQQAALTQVLPAATIEAAARLTHWVTENAKTTRAMLKRIAQERPLACALQDMAITELPREVHKHGDHGGTFDARPLLAPALQGHDLGLASEAGMPAIADPGSSLVRVAHELGIRVVPLVGPVSLPLALAASGLNGQDFAFVGYLPQPAAERLARLRQLEALALRGGQTQLFIETPYRNPALWQALLQGLQPNTRLAVASGLTLPGAVTACATVRQWKQRAAPVDADTPAIFLLGR